MCCLHAFYFSPCCTGNATSNSVKFLMRQRDFGWMQQIEPPRNVDEQIVRLCETEHQALLQSWEMRRTKRSSIGDRADLARYLDMPKSHITRLLNGTEKYIPWGKRVPFMYFVGNRLLKQWEDMYEAELILEREMYKAHEEAERQVEALKHAA